MTVTLELTSTEEARLAEASRRTGLPPAEAIHSVLAEHLPFAPTETALLPLRPRGTAAALLRRWMEEDATDDPEVIRRAEEDLAELKRNLNANRAATGERLPFPE